MERPKKHHYVPQFLLRNFTSDGGTRLYVFDKQTSKIFAANVADVAAENRLYEFSLGEVTATIEPSLADFESKAAIVLRTVLDKGSLAGLTLYQRTVLSGLVAQLLVRSPQQRAVRRHLNAELRKWVSTRGTDPDLMPELKTPNENEEKLFTAQALPSQMEQFAPLIFGKTWALHDAPISETLYISDNPVAMHNEKKIPHRGNLGLAVEGVEVYLPLSYNCCLGMYCPTVTSELMAAYEGYRRIRAFRIRPMPPAPPEAAERLCRAFRTGESSPLRQASVEFMNSLQVWNAERYVYSRSDNFQLAHEMVAQNPGLRKGPRPEAA